MYMKDQIITFETAKIAKEKGLQSGLKCEGCYILGWREYFKDQIGQYLISPRTTVEAQFHLALAPTQSLLQRWLRETHKISVEPYAFTDRGFEEWDWNISQFTGGFELLTRTSLDIGHFKTYEEALEAGLVYALNLLK